MNANPVRRCRIEKGWTQQKLALEAEVSLATISKAENSHFISDLSKSRIATALSMTVAKLFRSR